jgi:hypothetical protein
VQEVSYAFSESEVEDSDIASALDGLQSAQRAWELLNQRADRRETITLEEYMSATDASLTAKKHLIACLEQLPKEGFVLQATLSAGRTIMLTASAQKPGFWQLTRFDAGGEPWGDTQYPSRERALADFIDETDDLMSVADAMGPLFERGKESLEALEDHYLEGMQP